eukprot:GGOE01037097.1.p1 GENE.GGOE01037097.1~~GGOE01037097.1.p1  ORF type:complete len:291 (-),score=68.27 GGOE01037097.1:297-1070(-)
MGGTPAARTLPTDPHAGRMAATAAAMVPQPHPPAAAQAKPPPKQHGTRSAAPTGHVCAEQAEVVAGLLQQLEVERQEAAAKQQLVTSQQALLNKQRQQIQDLEKTVARLQQQLAQATGEGSAPKLDADALRNAGTKSPGNSAPSASQCVLRPSSPLAQSMSTSTSSPRLGRGVSPSNHAATSPAGLRIKPPTAGSPGQEIHQKPASKTGHSDDEGQKPPLISALFMAGVWVGRLAEVPYLPQDLTIGEYLSPANCLF